MNLAPIILFVYNRPEHTKKTLQALSSNLLAKESSLFIYSDGPKDENEIQKVQKVREIIKGCDGFLKVNIIERNKNLGLANNIRDGVTEIVNKYNSVIVLEDDLLTSTDFLTFMNSALNYYRSFENIYSISGYNFPMLKPARYNYDVFCSHRFISWGWGTWVNSWNKIDWRLSSFDQFINDKKIQKKFNNGGDDLSNMLFSQVNGRIDSWAIIWLYTHFMNNAYTICPIQSKVFNIGFDGTGKHCRIEHRPQTTLQRSTKKSYSFLENIFIDDYFVRIIRNFHKDSNKRKMYNLLKKFIKEF